MEDLPDSCTRTVENGRFFSISATFTLVALNTVVTPIETTCAGRATLRISARG